MKELLKNKYVVIAMVVLIIIIGFVLYKIISNRIKNTSKTLLNKVSDSIVIKNLTYKPVDYATWADSLYIAMKGAGTTESTIGEVLSKLKNADDWKALVKAFGIRGEEHWYSTDLKGNLVEWLQNELDSLEWNDVVKGLNHIGVNI